MTPNIALDKRRMLFSDFFPGREELFILENPIIAEAGDVKRLFSYDVCFLWTWQNGHQYEFRKPLQHLGLYNDGSTLHWKVILLLQFKPADDGAYVGFLKNIEESWGETHRNGTIQPSRNDNMIHDVSQSFIALRVGILGKMYFHFDSDKLF